MPPAAAAAAPAPPPAARTRLELVTAGGGSPAMFRADDDSPLVKAFKFVGWQPSAVAAKSEAPRHEIAGALLIQARAPRAADLSALDGLSILEHDERQWEFAWTTD